MSNKPNPVASTAAMLMWRAVCITDTHPAESASPAQDIHHAAALASDLHRLAPACLKLAKGLDDGTLPLGDSRITRRIVRLNNRLAPLQLIARFDRNPRNVVLYLVATDERWSIPDDVWGIL